MGIRRAKRGTAVAFALTAILALDLVLPVPHRTEA
jgi:hypothetical protein